MITRSVLGVLRLGGITAVSTKSYLSGVLEWHSSGARTHVVVGSNCPSLTVCILRYRYHSKDKRMKALLVPEAGRVQSVRRKCWSYRRHGQRGTQSSCTAPAFEFSSAQYIEAADYDGETII